VEERFHAATMSTMAQARACDRAQLEKEQLARARPIGLSFMGRTRAHLLHAVPESFGLTACSVPRRRVRLLENCYQPVQVTAGCALVSVLGKRAGSG